MNIAVATSKPEAEQRAFSDYANAFGRAFIASTVYGMNEADESIQLDFPSGVLVEVVQTDKSDIIRWNHEYLDPIWDVRFVGETPADAVGVRALTIYGPSYLLKSEGQDRESYTDDQDRQNYTPEPIKWLGLDMGRIEVKGSRDMGRIEVTGSVSTQTFTDDEEAVLLNCIERRMLKLPAEIDEVMKMRQSIGPYVNKIWEARIKQLRNEQKILSDIVQNFSTTKPC